MGVQKRVESNRRTDGGRKADGTDSISFRANAVGSKCLQKAESIVSFVKYTLNLASKWLVERASS